MKIESVEIIAFGKFKNKSLTFSDGLNVIYGANESGKSTIINFIYAMLYGFGDSRGKSLSLREKYVPWDSDFCEGKLALITDDNRHFTIYRKSGSVKKYDVLRIYDSISGEEQTVNIEQLVGVNADTFLKTLCVRQVSTVFDGSNDEITQKLSNIAKGGDESLNCEKALKLLDSARREIQPQRGNGGTLSEITQKIYHLEKAQKARQSISAERDSLNPLIESANRNVRILKEEYEKLLSENYTSPVAHISGRIDELSRRINSSLPLGICAFLSAMITFITLFIKTEISILFSAIFIICIIPLFKKNNIRAEIKNLISERENLLVKKASHEKKLSDLKANLDNENQKLSSLMEHRQSLQISESATTDELPLLYKSKTQLERKLRIVTLALEALKSAHANMQKNFTPLISLKASEYFSVITNKKYNRIFCDEAFGIKIDGKLPRESSFFSGGTVDQLYLSIRLALMDMIFKEKSCTMILDQPFIQYDDGRMANTVSLLENLPKSRQILLFTGEKNVISSNKATEILT